MGRERQGRREQAARVEKALKWGPLGQGFEQFIEVDPKGKARHRTARTARGSVAYTDPAYLEYELYLASAIGDTWPADWVPRGPLALDAVFFMPRSQELDRVYKSTGEPKYPPGPFPHTFKPDADNLIKAVKDAMGKAAARREYYRVLHERYAQREDERCRRNLERLQEKKKPLQSELFTQKFQEEVWEECLERFETWADDSIVVRTVVLKTYAPLGRPGGIFYRIWDCREDFSEMVQNVLQGSDKVPDEYRPDC